MLHKHRNKSGRSLQGNLCRSDSVLTSTSSCASLASLGSMNSLPSLSHSPSTNALNRSPDASAATAAGAGGGGSPQGGAEAADAPGSRNCVLRSTPFASPDAAQAVQQQQEQQVEAAAGRRKQPELVAFILLDPMWENGEEVGYVSSIVRMKRSAHQGGWFFVYWQTQASSLLHASIIFDRGVLQEPTHGLSDACAELTACCDMQCCAVRGPARQASSHA